MKATESKTVWVVQHKKNPSLFWSNTEKLYVYLKEAPLFKTRADAREHSHKKFDAPRKARLTVTAELI